MAKMEEGRPPSNATLRALTPAKPSPDLAPSPFVHSQIITYIKEQTWGDNVAVYDVEDRSCQVIRVCNGAALHVEFSSDGSEFMVAGRDNMIHVYDSGTLQLMCQLAGHLSDVLYCRASGDRNYAISGDTDGVVIVWDVDAGDALLKLQAHAAPVMSCDLSADCTRAYTLDSEGHVRTVLAHIRNIPPSPLSTVTLLPKPH